MPLRQATGSWRRVENFAQPTVVGSAAVLTRFPLSSSAFRSRICDAGGYADGARGSRIRRANKAASPAGGCGRAESRL